MSQEPVQLTGSLTPEPPIEMLPAHIAATKGDVDRLGELAKNAEPLVDPTTQETVLHAAVRGGAEEAVRYILREKLVSPTATTATARHTAAHYAVLYNQTKLLKMILTFDSALSEQLAYQMDEGKLSLLSLAALGGNKTTAEWLLVKFPNLANSANSNGNLAVHFAAAQGHRDIVKLLVEKCGKEMAEKQDSRQTKPVYFAAQEGRLKVLDYLINELGVDGVAKDKDGMCSVHAATQGGHPTTVKWLVNKLGKKYIVDKTADGGTPLHMAASQGNLDILHFFLANLENENDVNIQDSIQATPAHDAAEFGQTQAMILLLKSGADLTIQDYVNKTPYQLAVEQQHTELASLISDYRRGGLPAISKYEKKKKRSQEDLREKERSTTRTSRQEALELSSVIQATAEVVDKRKEQNMQRQESLQKLNEVGLDEPDTGRGVAKHHDNSNDIDHHIGPLGGIYARPSKSGRGKSGSKHNSDIEDFIEETMSHPSYSANKPHSTPYLLSSMDEGPYATINHETASNISRPSRVKRYHDSDSEVSSFAGSAGHFYNSGRYPMPIGGAYSQYPPPLPPPRRGPRSVASSRQSSQYSAPHMPYYPYPPGMMAPPFPYGYPVYAGGPGFPPQAYSMPMYRPPPGLYLQRHRLHHIQKESRKANLLNKKKRRGQNSSYDASTEHSDTQSPKKHTDQDIGYGPSLTKAPKAKEDDNFHPPAPPVTHTDGSMEANEVLTHDSNFIMARKTEDGSTVRKAGETTLNPNKNQRVYDGRYDKYIMTDSEPETDIPDHVGVACAAEAAAIVAIGCVAGLKGLFKMRKDKPSKVVGDTRHSENTTLSSAWDETQDLGRGPKKKQNNSLLRGMSPEDYASHEEWERGDWDVTEDKKKKKKRDKGTNEAKGQSEDTLEPQNELLTADLHKFASASVSKGLGEQILTSALGARHSSMMNIAASLPGSRMSLNVSSEEEADDDFNTAISMVTGVPMQDKVRVKQQRSFDLSGVGHNAEGEEIKMKKRKTKDTDTKRDVVKNGEKEQKHLPEEQQRKKHQEQELSDHKEREKKEHERKQQKLRDRKEQEKKSKKEQEAELKLKREQEKKDKKERERREKLEKQEQKTKEKELRTQAKKGKKDVKPTGEDKALVTQTTPSEMQAPKGNETHSSEVKQPKRKAPPPPVAVSGPREVANHVTMFDDTDNESEEEQPSSAKPGALPTQTKDPLTLIRASPTEPTSKQPALTQLKPQATPKQSDETPYIELDEQSLDIFGAEGLAELNEALRELSNIQSTPDFGPQPTVQPTKSVTIATTVQQQESQRSTMKKGVGGVISTKGGFTNTGGGRVITNGSVSSGMQTITSDKVSGGVQTSSAVTGTSNSSLTSTGIQGEGYSSSFEENVLTILKKLTDTMQQMRANPAVTQTEIQQQEILQQQMIQNLIAYSENNPDLTAKLLSMVKREHPAPDLVQSDATKSAFEMLEQKLLEAQEAQSRQAKDYFRTQEEFQQAMYKKLEEQSQQQLKLIQSNFEKYSQMFSEQSKKSRRKKKSKHKRESSYSQSASSGSSGSEDEKGLVRPMKQTALNKPAVKTMQARIYRQDLLDEDALRTSSQTSLTGKLREKKMSRDMLKRQETRMSFDRTQDALRRFESVSAPVDDDDDNDEMQMAQQVHPITLKRADIMKIKEQREAEEHNTLLLTAEVITSTHTQDKAQMRRIGANSKKVEFEKPMDSFDIKYGHHVVTNEHKKNVAPVDSSIEGAEGELASILKFRQKKL